MNRRQRRLIAWLGLVGIVFAQIAVSAHACLLRADAVDPAAAVALPHHGHCGGEQNGAPPMAPQGNACELQCSEAAPNAAAPDLPPVDVASAPVVVVPAPLPAAAPTCARSFLAADIAAPPLSLFCRLLN